MAEIHPFQISVPESRLKRLHAKLALIDFPSELESDTAVPWSRGPPTYTIKTLTEYWRNDFDWRKAEKSLNETLPQFITALDVEGSGDYKIHFVHLKSKAMNAIPLLFLHGWPGSFYEVLKIAHPLANGDGISELHLMLLHLL